MSLDRPVAPDPYALLPEVGSFTVSSPDMRDGEPVDLAYVYGPDAPGGGEPVPGAVLVRVPGAHPVVRGELFDPDAPTPSGFWHWTVVDIPADVTELARGRRQHRRRTICRPARSTSRTTSAPSGTTGRRRRRATRCTATSSSCTRSTCPGSGVDTVGERHRGVVQPGVPHPGPGDPRSRPTRFLTAVVAAALRPGCRRYRFGQHDPRPGVPGLADRHGRGRPVRRHLPERRLHPDQDVRLPGRRRRAAREAPPTRPARDRRRVDWAGMRDRIFAPGRRDQRQRSGVPEGPEMAEHHRVRRVAAGSPGTSRWRSR